MKLKGFSNAGYFLILVLLSLLTTDVHACSYCDKTVLLNKDVFECFIEKTDEYIKEAQEGPIVVNYGLCDDSASIPEFHQPNPRLFTPLIENQCTANDCAEGENVDDYLFLLSRTQLICLKKFYPGVVDPAKEKIEIELVNCPEVQKSE